MAWGGGVGSGDLAMTSADTLTVGVVSAQLADVLDARVSRVGSAFSMDVQSFTLSNPTLSTAGNVGSATALPATPETYITITVSGNDLKIPAFRV